MIRDIFPNVIVLHQDDFYRPEDQLPSRAGLLDWDCAAAIDVPGFVKALRYIKRTGRSPPELVSKEDSNDIGESGVKPQTIDELKKAAVSWETSLPASDQQRRICVVDGFLLFGQSVSNVRECFDTKIMLRASYEKAKKRREARSGYATIEGFWEDPPGYVDKVVWPSYVEEHAFIFEGGDVDGEVDETVAKELGIDVCPGKGEWDVEHTLQWLVSRVKTALAQGGL